MRFIFVLAAAVLASSSAFAADSRQPAQNAPQNPAIHSDNANNSNMPVAGANSFTESEAAARITARGYTHVSNLHKDDKGVWRGRARRHGRSVAVSVDYQGNVN